jgi:RNA polymerase sigma-70 factor, ECF subfamily
LPPTNPDEQDLITRVRSADTGAYRTLFERHQPALFRRVLYFVRDVEAAHDIVQETFVRIWEKRRTLKPGLSFFGLAIRISENLARDAARNRQTHERLRHRIPLPALSEGDDPVAALELSELEERLHEVMHEALAPRCRTVFMMSRFEQKTNQEIAQLLRISVKTVENQIHHALQVLRTHLQSTKRRPTS